MNVIIYVRDYSFGDFFRFSFLFVFNILWKQAIVLLSAIFLWQGESNQINKQCQMKSHYKHSAKSVSAKQTDSYC
jgi:hypothetical protein